MLKNIAKKILRKNRPTDRTKEYWQNAATKSVEDVMESICDKYDKETFESKKEGLIFSQKMQLTPDIRILDLACGMGRTCKWVAPYVKEYVGVDFIPEMIQKAKDYNSQFTNAKFFVNDGQTLNIFEDENFDIVYSELAFQHMLKDIQESYVKEVNRILKKNGVFYVQLPRIEYYKDSSYARTKAEVDKMFEGFDVLYTNEVPAYYYIKATKL